MIGDPRVGKTSLANVFTGKSFNDDQISTRGVDYVLTRRTPTRLEAEAGGELKIVLWDTAG